MTVHGFRHTHCSLLFAANVGVKQVQERLGHTDFKVTMNIYYHALPKEKSVTADVFASYLSDTK